MGCTTPNPSVNLHFGGHFDCPEDVVEYFGGFIGKHIDIAILEFGIPTGKETLSSGETIYQFYYSTSYIPPSISLPSFDKDMNLTYRETSPGTWNYTEQLEFLADPDGIIIKRRFRVY